MLPTTVANVVLLLVVVVVVGAEYVVGLVAVVSLVVAAVLVWADEVTAGGVCKATLPPITTLACLIRSTPACVVAVASCCGGGGAVVRVLACSSGRGALRRLPRSLLLLLPLLLPPPPPTLLLLVVLTLVLVVVVVVVPVLTASLRTRMRPLISVDSRIPLLILLPLPPLMLELLPIDLTTPPPLPLSATGNMPPLLLFIERLLEAMLAGVSRTLEPSEEAVAFVINSLWSIIKGCLLWRCGGGRYGGIVFTLVPFLPSSFCLCRPNN